MEGTHRWRHSIELAAAVRAVRLDELLDEFDERVAAGGKLRRKVASHYASQSDGAKLGLSPAESSAEV